MKKYLCLFTAIISTILVLFNFNYLSLLLAFLSLIFIFIFSKKDKRIFLFTIIICICTIVTNILILYKEYDNSNDIFKDTNVLLGSWLYNDIGGKYQFNEDNTYFQYISSNNLDNYCAGKYNYSYGGISNDGVSIKNDDNYCYYTLYLKTDYCIINGNKDNEIDNSTFVFSVNKNEYTDILFMDTTNNNAFKIIKSK